MAESIAPPIKLDLESDDDELKIKKPAVFFDLDGTWFRWQLFHEWIMAAVRLNILPGIVLEYAHAEYLAYKQRRGSFSTWVNRQVEAYQSGGRLKGVRVDDAMCVAESVIRTKGDEVHVFTRELSLAARDAGMHRAVISGSIREMVAAFAKANDIHIFLGTEHPSENGVFTGGPQEEWCAKKAAAVRHLELLHGLDLSGSAAIGDSSSDIPMLESVRYPICFNPNQSFLEEARKRQWPVVREKKDVILIFKPDENGRLHEVPLADILPADLAKCLSARLARQAA